MNVDPETRAYLEAVEGIVRRLSDGFLVGLYATGSLSLGDFDCRRSDIDLLGLIGRPLTRSEKKGLQVELEHGRLPCPAHGLDFTLVTADVAASPPRKPQFDFAMSTGHSWRLETSEGEADGELLLHLAICRQSGAPLCGPIPAQAFGPVSREWLLEELIAILRWHATCIFDPYHDPLGQFSTLNACRAWHFVEHNRFCSKTEGGRWVLARNPDCSLVAAALANRSGKAHRQGRRSEIEAFLGSVGEIVEKARCAQQPVRGDVRNVGAMFCGPLRFRAPVRPRRRAPSAGELSGKGLEACYSYEEEETPMPEISRFFGIIVRMFFDEHHPPHVHAEYQGHKAVFDLEGNVTRGSLSSRTATRLVREWVDLHAGELREDWELAQAGRELRKIAPLD